MDQVDIHTNENDHDNPPPDLLWDTIKSVIAGVTISYATRKKRDRDKQKKDIENEILDLHRKIQDPLCPAQVYAELQEAQGRLNEILNLEIEGAKVRSKVTWAKYGEKCSQFFCNLERNRSQKKTVTSLKLADDTVTSNHTNVMKEIKEFYQKLYRKTADANEEELGIFLNNIDLPKLSESEKDQMEDNLTADECLKVLKTMQCDKSPGMDGLPVEFYTTFWPDISELLLKSYEYSYNRGSLSTTQRLGLISLIPKPDRDLLLIKNFRPITLLNVDVKIAAKVIASRIKGNIGKLVHTDQSGFIKGRQIGDAIRTTLDMINAMERDHSPGAIILLDIEKAFDSLERDYMFSVLKKFNFGDNLIKWISTIYQNRESRISNNGNTTDSILMERGVFQGCPLSPYLFILCIEPLAATIRQNENIKGLKVGGTYKKISLFADNATVFTKGNDQSFEEIFRILRLFGRISGCRINMAKTEAVWLGSKKQCRNKPFTQQGIKWKADRCFKSLGINFCIDTYKMFNLNYEPRLEKLKNTATIWSKRKLTLLGKVTIIKTFMLSQLMFLSTTLPVSVPGSFFRKVDSILYNFLWDGRPDKVRRDTIIGDYSEGGIKMIHAESFYTSQVFKSIIKLLHTDENDTCGPTWKSIELDTLKALYKDESLLFKCNNPSAKTVKQIGLESLIQAIAVFNKYVQHYVCPGNRSLWYNKYLHKAKRRSNDLFISSWYVLT